MATGRLTMNEVAQIAGFSKATVSLVLNGKADEYRISPSTIAKINEVVNDSGYILNNQARNFRQQKTKTIGIILPDLQNHYFQELISEIEKNIRPLGYQIMLGISNEEPALEKEIALSFQEQAVDGLLIASCMNTPNYKIALDKHTIFIDRPILSENFHNINSDNFQTSFQITDLLAKKANGKIYYLSGTPHLSTTVERKMGFMEAIKQNQLKSFEIKNGLHHKSSGFQLAREILSNIAINEIVCLFASSWPLMEGVLEYLKESQWNTKNLVIASFDHHPVLDFISIPSISAKQDTIRIAQKATEVLFNDKTPQRQTIKTNIITRNFLKKEKQ